jgi:hypothetical protein
MTAREEICEKARLASFDTRDCVHSHATSGFNSDQRQGRLVECTSFLQAKIENRAKHAHTHLHMHTTTAPTKSSYLPVILAL